MREVTLWRYSALPYAAVDMLSHQHKMRQHERVILAYEVALMRQQAHGHRRCRVTRVYASVDRQMRGDDGACRADAAVYRGAARCHGAMMSGALMHLLRY